MSIAVTVLIAPSRRLRCLLAGVGACLLAAACAVCLPASGAFAGGPLVAAALLFAGACVLHAALRRATVQRIDISGPGRIRLTVQQGVRQDTEAGSAATLLAGSTLWPCMLVLRLATPERARAHAIAVLPDSLAPEAFRALLVALGSVEQGPPGSSMEHKIR